MGAFFTNLQVRGASTEAICNVLPKLTTARAYVSPQSNGWVTVYPEATETQSDTICAMAEGLSKMFKTDVLGFLVHDSDIAIYWLYRCGDLLDHFNSAPDYFDEADAEMHDGVRSDTDALLPLCVAGTNRTQLDRILHPPAGHPTFAEEIIANLATLLGINDTRASLGFEYFNREGADLLPDAASFEPVGPDAARKVAQTDPPARSDTVPPPIPASDGFLFAITMLTMGWSEQQRSNIQQFSKIRGQSVDDLLKNTLASFDKSASNLLKKSKLPNPPTFEELKSARDQSPDALAALIAEKTPAQLTDLGIIAANNNLADFLAALLKYGLDPTAASAAGQTTLAAAAHHGPDSAIYRLAKAAAGEK